MNAPGKPEAHLLGARGLGLQSLVFVVIAWWIFYRWRRITEWNYYLFLFLLRAPTFLHLASLVLFPPR